jgi:hypothetical protein
VAYTSGDHLIRPIMTAYSGLPEDQIVNDFAFRFDAGSPTSVDILAIMNVVGQFYRAGATAADQVGTYISNFVSRAATHEIAAYKIVAGPLGSPVATIPWLGPVTAGATTLLPSEVAGTLSFHGDLTAIPEESGATRPRSRRRGRVYIGPLQPVAVTNSSAPAVLAPAFTAAMRSNATVMYDAAEALGWTWCVWSRADATLYPVVAGWTDNAPDTMRKRGQEATLRTVFTTV